ncbi:MAG: ribulose-phosphate 3-epimerase [Bacilli bacterium]|nr:ribulose-phosphate 3-epimerase [Bacilli bacterium]
MIVAPSILSADFSKLLEEVQEVKKNGAQFLHIDVMDGHFVPNISLGSVVYKDLKGKVDIVFDVHLMISDPVKYAKDFVTAGADYITFHMEAVDNPKETIDYIKSLGVKVGLSIKPNTSIDTIVPYLNELDLVLVMSVEPGFGGQKFMESSIPKILKLKELKEKNKYNYLIQVDGGINDQTAKQVALAGVEVIVAGTYIFKSINRERTIKELLEL